MDKVKKRSSKARKGIRGFQVIENECIWMKAGVVSFKNCDNAYNCNDCAFDKGMQHTLGRPKVEAHQPPPISGWAQQLRQRYDGANLPCRHALTGRIEAPKVCTLNYECYHCAFDQMLDEVDLYHLSAHPTYYLASGYKLAQGCYYDMGHCWVRFEHGGNVRLGLDDFIVRLFGTMEKLTLPPLGGQLEQHQVGLSFTRSDRHAEVLAPLTGRVLAVNPKAAQDPEIACLDPYHEGWLCVLEPDYPKKSMKKLFYGDASVKWIDQESRRLLAMLGEPYRDLAATGGEPIRDVFGQFPELGWEALVADFLRTRPR
jgi:glycine cleavage system H lipoate-binding protein